MKSGDILIHRISGTFAEIVSSPHGFSLSFTIRSYVSKTRGYSEDEILKDWRYPSLEEMELHNKGKLSIK